MDSPRLVAFDLDDTLAESKSPISPDMARALAELLAWVPVCVISGGMLSQIERQVVQHLPPDAALANLHLMPTCGTRYLRHDGTGWHEVYSHPLDPHLRRRAIDSLERRARELGFWEPDDAVWGDRIEDRESQITFSALGQQAPAAAKRLWDPTGDKRLALRAAVADDLPELSVRAGGSTSIDITEAGIDKAFGLTRLTQATGIPAAAMLFFGDRLDEGGNDYPVTRIGMPVRPVTGPEDTLRQVRALTAEVATARPAIPARPDLEVP